MTFKLRSMLPADAEFLYQLYASTREEELSRVPWLPSQKDAFLRMQFRAQSAYYGQVYPNLESGIVMVEGKDAGRLLVAESETELHIVDISMLPEYRNAGIGTRLIRGVFDRAALSEKVVGIDVEIFNRARKLYDRLGFEETGREGVYAHLRWRSNVDRENVPAASNPPQAEKSL